jgi:hypothetical protein
MTEYSTVLETALVKNSFNFDSFKVDNTYVQQLEVICSNVVKSWAPFKAVTVSVAAKLIHSDWDTRNHQTQLGGKCSLRSIDKNYVSDFLFKNGYYDTPTEFALTRSFEKCEPFHENYSGNISPKPCKLAFLNIVRTINTQENDGYLEETLVYLLCFLKRRKGEKLTLINSSIVLKRPVDSNAVFRLCEFISDVGSGGSVVPIIAMHTLLELVQPKLWHTARVNPLKHHTASDKHGSYGDLEVLDVVSSLPIVVVEGKHKIAINDSIVRIFETKVKLVDVPFKYIVTTHRTPFRITDSNIWIEEFTSFIMGFLQRLQDAAVYASFVLKFRKDVLAFDNLSMEVKETLSANFEILF